MFLWMIYVARTGNVSSETNQGRQNQALEQTRDNVLRYGEVAGCELLNFFVRRERWNKTRSRVVYREKRHDGRVASTRRLE